MPSSSSIAAISRTHTGRWEPLLGRADLRTADLVVTLLAPYFDASSY